MDEHVNEYLLSWIVFSRRERSARVVGDASWMSRNDCSVFCVIYCVILGVVDQGCACMVSGYVADRWVRWKIPFVVLGRCVVVESSEQKRD